MKITRMKQNGKTLTTEVMQNVQSLLQIKLENEGFITDVRLSEGKIGIHMRCFSIDVDKLGHNAQVSTTTQISYKKGSKRTNSPTWTQREEFNHIINNVFDYFGLSAKIVSGEYSIRDHITGRVNSWDMPEVFHNGYRLQVPSVLEIVPMCYAEDAVEWIGINAPFVAVVPETQPRFKKVS